MSVPNIQVMYIPNIQVMYVTNIQVIHLCQENFDRSLDSSMTNGAILDEQTTFSATNQMTARKENNPDFIFQTNLTKFGGFHLLVFFF